MATDIAGRSSCLASETTETDNDGVLDVDVAPGSRVTCPYTCVSSLRSSLGNTLGTGGEVDDGDDTPAGALDTTPFDSEPKDREGRKDGARPKVSTAARGDVRMSVERGTWTGVAQTSGNAVVATAQGEGGRIKYNGDADGYGFTVEGEDVDDEVDAAPFNGVISTLNATEVGTRGRRSRKRGVEKEEDACEERLTITVSACGGMAGFGGGGRGGGCERVQAGMSKCSNHGTRSSTRVTQCNPSEHGFAFGSSLASAIASLT